MAASACDVEVAYPFSLVGDQIVHDNEDRVSRMLRTNPRILWSEFLTLRPRYANC